MTEKNLSKENKNEKKLFTVIILVGWIFFIGLFIGRAIGIIVTHDDVTNIGEFFNRLAIWDFFYILVFALLITGSITIKKKQKHQDG